MQPVIWCNLCQKQPATGILVGHFQGDDEEHELMTCKDCANRALDTGIQLG